MPQHRTEEDWSQEKIQELINAYKYGKSTLTISRQYGIGHWVIYDFLKRHGVVFRSRTYYLLKRETTIKTPLDKTVTAYVAGILDGEGTIFKNRYGDRYGKTGQMGLAVSIANTNMTMLEYVQNAFGGKIVGMRPNASRFSKLPIYQWKIQSFIDVMTFLEQVEPYLIIKRKKAIEAIEFCRKEFARLV